jgi:hypothetical protein
MPNVFDMFGGPEHSCREDLAEGRTRYTPPVPDAPGPPPFPPSWVNPKDVSLQDARDFLAVNQDEGVQCPCCNQTLKVYKRTIYSTTASWLQLLVAASCEGEDFVFVDVKDIDARGGDYAKLRHWGLVRPSPTGSNSGWWKPTEAGVEFVKGSLEVPRDAFIVNNTLVGFSEVYVTMSEALGQGLEFDL